jgi:beta-1,4-mannooligosaccharide phosphorylase
MGHPRQPGRVEGNRSARLDSGIDGEADTRGSRKARNCAQRRRREADPTRVLHRLPTWILAPVAPYERTGDVPNVVFSCGLIHDRETGVVRLYYGAADSSICVAIARLADLLDAVLAAPAEAQLRQRRSNAGRSIPWWIVAA